uniref:Helitron helicase-like domain-containing protein n=1 Tax=Mycena chlorophos TaxID=658473 RepID=A0ABQ0L834_MYCCL|nr:predicted protein [Mycena chlorophos]
MINPKEMTPVGQLGEAAEIAAARVLNPAEPAQSNSAIQPAPAEAMSTPSAQPAAPSHAPVVPMPPPFLPPAVQPTIASLSLRAAAAPVRGKSDFPCQASQCNRGQIFEAGPAILSAACYLEKPPLRQEMEQIHVHQQARLNFKYSPEWSRARAVQELQQAHPGVYFGSIILIDPHWNPHLTFPSTFLMPALEAREQLLCRPTAEHSAMRTAEACHATFLQRLLLLIQYKCPTQLAAMQAYVKQFFLKNLHNVK